MTASAAQRSHLKPLNKLLARLPAEDYGRLAPFLETVRLSSKDVLLGPSAVLQRVYFPEGGVCSMTCMMADGETVDVAAVGNEGLIGVAEILRGDTELHEAVVRIPTDAQALSVTVFRREIERGGSFSDTMHRYAQAFVATLIQSAACNALHPIEQRCSRWLLDIHDRVGQPEFPLTQELLAAMLGVRRASVTTCAGALQHDGIIDYGRNRMVVRDRARLETTSCECYAATRRYFASLLP